MFSIIGVPYKHVEQLKFEDFILVKENIKEKLTILQVKQKKKVNASKILKIKNVFEGVKYKSR